MQVPLVCHGHSRPVVDLFYSPVTPDGFFLISASKGKPSLSSIFGVFIYLGYAIMYLIHLKFVPLILIWAYCWRCEM